MATAFGLLVLLMVVIALIGSVVGRFLRSAAGDGAAEPTEPRNRALAAVIAVTALLSKAQRARNVGDDG